MISSSTLPERSSIGRTEFHDPHCQNQASAFVASPVGSAGGLMTNPVEEHPLVDPTCGRCGCETCPGRDYPSRCRGTMTLQKKIEALEAELVGLRAQQQRCPHSWGPTVSDPRIEGGYSVPLFVGCRTIPGHDQWVERTTIRRWARTCKTCGLQQHTEQTESRRTVNAQGLFTTEEIPLFPGVR